MDIREFGIIVYVDGDYRIRQTKSGFQVYKLDIPIGEKLQSLTGAIQFINERKEIDLAGKVKKSNKKK